LTNIIDGMDQARFKAGHPNPQKEGNSAEAKSGAKENAYGFRKSEKWFISKESA